MKTLVRALQSKWHHQTGRASAMDLCSRQPSSQPPHQHNTLIGRCATNYPRPDNDVFQLQLGHSSGLCHEVRPLSVQHIAVAQLVQPRLGLASAPSPASHRHDRRGFVVGQQMQRYLKDIEIYLKGACMNKHELSIIMSSFHACVHTSQCTASNPSYVPSTEFPSFSSALRKSSTMEFWNSTSNPHKHELQHHLIVCCNLTTHIKTVTSWLSASLTSSTESIDMIGFL